MLRKLYTLGWAQWRQQSLALGIMWAFLLGIFCAVAYMDTYTSLLIKPQFLFYPSVCLWLIGMVLIFTEQDTTGLSFCFPTRHATLPLRTWLLTATVLLTRILITTIHTTICLSFVLTGPKSWYGSVVEIIHQLPIPVTLAVFLQWAAFVKTYRSTTATVIEILSWSISLPYAAFFTYRYADEYISLPLVSPLLVGLAPALALCIHAGYQARHGRRNRALGTILNAETLLLRMDFLPRLPATPIWTQTWFEFRSATVWFPIGLVSISIVGLGIPALTISNQLDIWELQSISYAGIGTAFVVGYLWERRNSVNIRFRIAIPMSDTHLSIARSLACLLAIALGLIGIAVTIGLLLLIRGTLGYAMLTADDLLILSFRTLSEIGLWWIALTVGRLLFVLSLASIVWFILMTALFWEFSSDNEQYLIVSLLTVLQLSLTAMAFHAQRHHRGTSPYFWLVPIFLLPVSVLEEFLGPIYLGTMYLNAADLTLFTLYPISLACLTLYYAWASGFMTLRLGACLIVGGLVSVPLVNFLDVLSSYPRAPYYESETTLYVAFALMLPFLWFPLLNRFQRYG